MCPQRFGKYAGSFCSRRSQRSLLTPYRALLTSETNHSPQPLSSVRTRGCVGCGADIGSAVLGRRSLPCQIRRHLRDTAVKGADDSENIPF